LVFWRSRISLANYTTKKQVISTNNRALFIVTSMDIQAKISLHDKNWFGTGGPAHAYCEPHSAQDFAHALIYAHDHTLPIFVLGLGANILISDDGFDGLVIRPQLKKITHIPHTQEILLTADAGVTIQELINYCLDNNMLGLEEFSGIPGTVGGSLFINIHYFQYLLSNFVVQAEVINKTTYEISTVDHAWLNFGYDHSQLHQHTHYLLNATFKLKSANDLETAYARGRNQEIIRHRMSRYPKAGTCGCFFRNFHDHEVTLTSNGKKMTYSSYYFDKLGIKGELTHGGAQVSYQHANMIVNTGTATSHDIIAVARIMQRMVYEKFGLMPEPECQLIGFKEYPLLQLTPTINTLKGAQLYDTK